MTTGEKLVIPEITNVGELIKILRHRGTAYAWAHTQNRGGQFYQTAFRLHKDELIRDLKRMAVDSPILFYYSDRDERNNYESAWVERTVYIGRSRP